MKDSSFESIEASTVLILGEPSIQLQFIRRELEKEKRYVISCWEPHLLENNALSVNQFNLIVTSYPIAIETTLLDIMASSDKRPKLVVFDLPKSIPDENLSLFFCFSGTLFENSPVEHLTRCVEAVMQGEHWIPRRIVTRMLSAFQVTKETELTLQQNNELTRREQQIVKHILDRKSNQEIAEALFIAESTVKTHIYRLYKKLKVSNRKETIEKLRGQTFLR